MPVETYAFSQAQASITTTTPNAQAQADIKAITRVHAQALADIKQTYPRGIPVSISWNIWISHNNNGTFKRETISLRRDNVAGAVLASFDTGASDGGDNGGGHQFNWNSSTTDNSPTTGRYVISVKETAAGVGNPANTQIFSDTRTFSVVGQTSASNTTSPSGNVLVVTGTTETLLPGCDVTVLVIIGSPFGQAKADILVTTFAVAQAQASILKSAGYANAQAKINAFGINNFAQAQARIKQTYFGLAQAQAFIRKSAGYANAQAKIKAFDIPNVAQAQASISNIPYLFAVGTGTSGTGNITPALPVGWAVDDVFLLFVNTANFDTAPSAPTGWSTISNSPQGNGIQFQGNVKLSIFWRRAVAGDTAPTITDTGDHQSAVIEAYRNCVQFGIPWTATSGTSSIDANFGPLAGSTTDTPTLVVLGIARSVNAGVISVTNSDLGTITQVQSYASVTQDGPLLVVYNAPKLSAGTYGNTIFQMSNSFPGGVRTAGMTIALRSRGGQGFAQAAARITAVIQVSAQALATITPYYLTDDIADALTITETSAIFTQDIDSFTTDTNSTDPSQIANFHSGWIKIVVPYPAFIRLNTLGSLIDTEIAVYSGTPGDLTAITFDAESGLLFGDGFFYEGGGGSTSYLYPTGLQAVSADTYYVEVSTANGDSLTRLLRFNYSIEPVAAYGNARSSIKATYSSFGQAQALLNQFFARAQAQAQITGGRAFQLAQAQAFIRKSAGYAQAAARMKGINIVGRGQAKADIKQTYSGFGQAQARYVYTYFQPAQAMACIVGWGFGQAQADIKQTYNAFGQATVWTKRTERTHGQGSAEVAYRSFYSAQAQALIIRVEPPAPTPTGRDFGPPEYVVFYDGFQLAGYPQSESIISQRQLDDFQSFDWDGSITQQAGQTNFTLTMEFVIYDVRGWHSAKEQYFATKSQLLSPKGYRALNIDAFDGSYQAIVRGVRYEQHVPTRRRLNYSVDFECQPWATSDITRELFGTTGTITTDDVGRTVSDGTWTPTVINMTGTNITISGYTDTEFTGYASISGYVSDMVIDTQEGTATVFDPAENGESYIYNVDHGIFVGTGKTSFAVTGADNISISYRNRW